MWQKLSLRARLNTILALILVLGLATNIARLLLEAGPRVQAEDQSVIRLARGFVETLVAGLNESPDPEARLNRIIEDFNRLRHVSITREISGKAASAPSTIDDGPNGPPAWFVALVRPERTSVSVPVTVNGISGSLVITSHPNDEMNEIWDGIVTQILIGSTIATTLLLITMIIVGRAVAPIGALTDAMTAIERGDYGTRVKQEGPPELAAIGDKLNHLAGTLEESVEDKRRLAERVVSMQDVERKELARELHDEIGPHLFALRAHVSSLVRIAETREPDVVVLRKHGAAIWEQVNALQQFNRRVLEKLRPVGLAEFGLREAIGALLRLWREARPGVAIETTISPLLGEPGESADLTIYRIVQEALTNVFRHSDATRIEVMIGPLGVPSRGGRGSILVRVRDNGSGLHRDHKLGHGLIGMRERVRALGGAVTVTSGDGGVTVEAVVPCDDRAGPGSPADRHDPAQPAS
jgi:two-component system sensor histidine kinase UhpB